jgi:hypothetical protein
LPAFESESPALAIELYVGGFRQRILYGCRNDPESLGIIRQEL